MEDQILSLEKYQMENSCNKKIFQMDEKKLYNKNIFFEYKFVLIEWKYILISYKYILLNRNE